MDGKFIAFISYSRKDKAIADWLHRKFESYRLPADTDLSGIFDFKSSYFRPVFLDTQDLHVENRPFTERIRSSLENSSFLIVLCSKNSAKSEFVEREISYFLKVHDNNYSRIVPLFVDEVDMAIPPVFEGSTIMQRHFPIYNSKLDTGSEANSYCFYQIIAYILGLNFSDVYNRYEIQSRREEARKRRILTCAIFALLALIGLLSAYHYEFRQKSREIIEQKLKIIENEQRRIDVEKNVFPQAVVDGYEKNFLSPFMKRLKKQAKPFKIFILMPENEKDLSHSDRVDDFEYQTRLNNTIDSLRTIQFDTDTKRGNRVFTVVQNGHEVEGIYIDFATTTSSFLTVANYKKNYSEYSSTPVDLMIEEYSYKFRQQINERLGRDSVYVEFFMTKDALIGCLEQMKAQTGSHR